MRRFSFASVRSDLSAPLVTAMAAGVIGIAVLLAYHRCFAVPFLFDDLPAIRDSNPSIRTLSPIWAPLFPPHEHGQTVGGRPIPNFTLALNYAISGLRPWSYHLLNLVIHGAAALTLFAVVRQTLRRETGGVLGGLSLREQFGAAAAPLALCVALIWAVHPVQTESVTYVVQRVESIMGLCYLLTFNFFLRSLDSPNPRAWQAATVVACLIGMASKEVMATAPLALLLYDRLFVAGSLAEAWKRRRGLYSALGATWILLAVLVFRAEGRGGTAGFAVETSLWGHLLTQVYALGHYLRLVVWPNALVFDYGFFVVRDAWSVAPTALLLVVLLMVVLRGTWRNRAWSFLGVWFFLILAPTAIVPVPVQTVAEHRMYLPLAGAAAGLVLLVYRGLGSVGFVPLVGLAIALGWLTDSRNQNYRSPLSIWESTVRNHPGGSARADFNYADLLAAEGRREEAADQLRAAIRLEPRFAAAYDNLGSLWLNRSEPERALRYYRKAIQLDPTAPDPLFHAGLLLEQLGQTAEAVRDLQTLLWLAPNRADAHLELGNALFHAERLDQALAEYRLAEQTGSISAEANSNIGTIWFQRRDYAQAVRFYRQALLVGADSVDTRVNLGNALALTGQMNEAAEAYRAALRLDPTDTQAQENLTKILRLPTRTRADGP